MNILHRTIMVPFSLVFNVPKIQPVSRLHFDSALLEEGITCVDIQVMHRFGLWKCNPQWTSVYCKFYIQCWTRVAQGMELFCTKLHDIVLVPLVN